MAFARILTRTAQSHALIDCDIIAYLGRFADNNAHTVIDKETVTYGRAWMYFDSRKSSCKLRNKPCKELKMLFP